MNPTLKKQICSYLKPHVDLDEKSILSSLEVPKKLEHGHLAFPVFPLAKVMKKAPPIIAKELLPNLLRLRCFHFTW